MAPIKTIWSGSVLFAHGQYLKLSENNEIFENASLLQYMWTDPVYNSDDSILKFSQEMGKSSRNRPSPYFQWHSLELRLRFA